MTLEMMMWMTYLVAALSFAEKGLTFSGSAPAAACASANSCTREGDTSRSHQREHANKVCGGVDVV
jgi:hypothetical protein